MDDADRYQMEQMLLRLGRKRTLAALEQVYPSDYAEVASKTIISVITSVALLARVLSPLWPSAATLARVCKHFASAAKHREFWMPAVRGHLRRTCPEFRPSFIAYINPFFRFPEHVWMCPGWEWYAFLEWLFAKDAGSSIKVIKTTQDGDPQWMVMLVSRGREVLRFRTDIEVEDAYSSTEWMILPKYDGEAAPLWCLKVEAGENTPWGSGYDVKVKGKLVWTDGNVCPDIRQWCGAVRSENLQKADSTTTTVSYAFEPHGFYRDGGGSQGSGAPAPPCALGSPAQ